MYSIRSSTILLSRDLAARALLKPRCRGGGTVAPHLVKQVINHTTLARHEQVVSGVLETIMLRTGARYLILRNTPYNGLHCPQSTVALGEDILSGAYARREEKTALEKAELQALVHKAEAQARHVRDEARPFQIRWPPSLLPCLITVDLGYSRRAPL